MDGAEFNKTPSSPREGVEEEWECFCDEGYYDHWAVRDKNGDRAFTSVIHVGTKEEAEFLVSRLNASQTSAPDAKKNK